jgi:hypothetical protein
MSEKHLKSARSATRAVEILHAPANLNAVARVAPAAAVARRHCFPFFKCLEAVVVHVLAVERLLFYVMRRPEPSRDGNESRPSLAVGLPPDFPAQSFTNDNPSGARASWFAAAAEGPRDCVAPSVGICVHEHDVPLVGNASRHVVHTDPVRIYCTCMWTYSQYGVVMPWSLVRLRT